MMAIKNKKLSVSTGVLLGTSLLLGACGASTGSKSKLQSLTSDRLNGTWAKVIRSSTDVNTLGARSKTQVKRLNLLNMYAEGDQLVVQEKTCLIQSENSGAASINFPSAIAAGTPDRYYRYQVWSSGSTLAASIEQAHEIFGAQLDQPLYDSLPYSADDYRLIDQDGDSYPGVTVNVGLSGGINVSGSIYVVQRLIWNESLQFDDENTANGSYVWTQEQSVLGGTDELFTTILPEITPLFNESWVALRRLPWQADCEQAKAQVGGLM